MESEELQDATYRNSAVGAIAMIAALALVRELISPAPGDSLNFLLGIVIALVGYGVYWVISK